ncbi:isoleucine--tRNA ligase [Candidatus Woesearchaeota archaeon]|nr:isoleucine--tRNA ligase [Candidatus Woesearchaeota archaeon]
MFQSYDFKIIELEILKFWDEKKIYEKLKKRGSKGKPFYFLQGPPYTSGRLHIGHAWNNTLKDSVLRFKRMRGYDVWDRAGYDMHGLPTENKVQQKFELETKKDILKFGMQKFVEECKEFSTTNAKMMDQDLLRLGVWMDYENAYYPLSPEFIEGEWWLIKKAFDQGRIYKGLKSMTWCGSCETALAKHELEYENVKENSIFVKMKSKEKGKKNEYFMVWTTTPWTIPYNLGIMVNPGIEYVRAEVEYKNKKNEVWIVAKPLAGVFIQGLMEKRYKILEEFMGEKLEGIPYEHPFSDVIPFFKSSEAKKNDRIHTILLSEEFVDTSAGTGLVHCAPGCGPEDFEVGKKYGLPAFNTLDEKGDFHEIPEFSGKKAKKDDSFFVEELRKRGALLDTTTVEHEYPHCWRCHKPVIFRTTEQYFLKIEDLRDRIKELGKNVQWVPSRGKEDFERWTSNLKDNSITRQRYWGAPVPIWECKNCKSVTCIGSRKELKQKAITPVPEDLHKPYIDEVKIKCECGGIMERISDVLDVWIDAGTTSWNCLYYPAREDYFKKYFPADFILEATEQVRLWFSLLSICSTITLDRQPFKAVYMHGMMLDYQGMKMSKSLGNIISPYEVIDKHGADVLRYYMGGVSAGENINFSWEDLGVKQRNLGVLWNLHKLVLTLAEELNVNPAKKKSKNKAGKEEEYALSLITTTIQKVTNAFETYHLDEVPILLERGYLELSRTYVQMVREKMSDEDEKHIVLETLYESITVILQLLAPIVPYATEAMYQNFREAFKLKEESIHEFEWPVSDEKIANPKLEEYIATAQDIIRAVLSAREQIKRSVRWPIQEITIVTTDKKVKDAVKTTKEIILSQCNTKKIKIAEKIGGVKHKARPNFTTLGKTYGKETSAIGEHIKQNSEKVAETLIEKDTYEFTHEGTKRKITKEHIITERETPPHLQEGMIINGHIYITKDTTPELDAEGYAREITRRVQALRKKAGLKRTDKVSLYITTSEHLQKNLAPHIEIIKEKTGSVNIHNHHEAPTTKLDWSEKDKIKEEKIEIGLNVL